MRLSKKTLGAVAMSVVMVGGQVMPALAADGDATPTTTPAPSATGGTANILDYAVESVVVPTALKITLNPNGYPITTGYVKETATSPAAGTVYYEKKSDGTFEKMASQPTSFAANTDYYKAVTANDQVVSLNYGVANKSTDAKTVKVDFAATYDAATGKKAIEFVDSANKAEAYAETTNEGGAKAGEYKMYLAVASASAVPTANTYVKTTDATAQSGKTYYTKTGDGYTAASSAPTDMTAATYYEATTTIGPEISADELSDVSMTKATAGIQAFAKGNTNKADASIAYSLSAATYNPKAGETIDFTTTQAQLGSKLELATLGGVAGFTLTGKVNANADWSQADATAIIITPTYTITNATGTETVVSGAHNQVEIPAEPTITLNGRYSRANRANSFDLTGLGTATITKVEALNGEGAVFAEISSSSYTLEESSLKINGSTAPWGAGAVGDSRGIKVTLSNGKVMQTTFTVNQ